MRLAARLLLTLALAAALVPAATSLASTDRARPPAPVLIQRALDAGTLDAATGNLYLAQALFAPAALPEEYRSDTPFHGTVWLLKVRNALEAMPEGPERTAIEQVLAGPTDPGTSVCELSPAPSTSTLETAHFFIEYNAAEVDNGPDGLTIQDFAESLEKSWTTEVDAFGWAAPPILPTAPQGKYLVKVQNLSPVVYGYVSNFGTGAGLAGDNPNTSWDDEDAYASCMGLNSDYSAFPGTPQRALDATTAHEFNHTLQFGLGALHGPNAPDSVFVEGGATWMEDEVFDSSNDNYNYLWPAFEDDMGDNEDSPYGYFITWRGLTERYGSSIPNAGENVMQKFWELTSQNAASNLDALDKALRAHRATLPKAYHAYAIAVKFNRACGGGYKYPHCLEEGPQYVEGDGVQSGAGETEPHGSIAEVGGSFTGAVPDNYALNWVVLPTSAGTYRVTFENTSAGGKFQVSVACDTGKSLKVWPLSGLAQAGQTVERTLTRTSICTQLVAVVTNVSHTAANPSESLDRAYTLSTTL